jgi:hypothetical protein
MSKWLDQLRERIRAKQYSFRTELAYLNCSCQIILLHQKQRPLDMGEIQVSQL